MGNVGEKNCDLLILSQIFVMKNNVQFIWWKANCHNGRIISRTKEIMKTKYWHFKVIDMSSKWFC